MTVSFTTAPTVFRPAAPVPPMRALRLIRRVAALRANPITAFSEEAYQTPFMNLSALRPVLLVNDPQTIVRILVENADNYRKSIQQRRRLEPALGEGLLTAEGDDWKNLRRLTAPLFTPRAIKRLYDDMYQATQAMAERWLKRSDPAAPLDLQAEFQRLTYEIVSRTVFSGELDAERAAVHAHMATYFDTVGRVDLPGLLGFPAWWPDMDRMRVRSSIRVFRNAIEKSVVGRQIPGARTHDLLDQLLSAKGPNTNDHLSRKTVIDNALTFLAAGHETTGNALAWAFYLLTQSPSAMQMVREEASTLDSGVLLRGEGMKHLTFGCAVLNETMRLYPPAPFIGREAIASDTLGGQPIRRGTQIVISPWIVHRHRSLWPQPDFFRPERFLAGAADGIPRGAFLPFGLGPRTCIGNGFAMQEMLIVLTTLAGRFDFDLVDRDHVEPVATITLHPKNGVFVRVTPRPQ